MSMEFFCYTLPMVVLATMIIASNMHIEIELSKLENRVRELEQTIIPADKEGEG